MKSALIVGEDSTIGKALAAHLRASGVEVFATSRRQGATLRLDLAAPESWPVLPDCDTAFICAAVSKLADCENAPEAARRINVEHTAKLAEKLHAAGAFVVFLSSNQVFDGSVAYRKAGDAPCAINAYGRQKAETERALAALPNAAILRITKVIAPGDERIAAWAGDLRAGKNVTAFDDIFLSPITLENVADALKKLGETHTPGIHQLSGETDFSYYDLACAIARHVGAKEENVMRGSGEKAGVPAAFRPRYSSYAPGDFPHIRVPDIDGIVRYALKN